MQVTFDPATEASAVISMLQALSGATPQADTPPAPQVASGETLVRAGDKPAAPPADKPKGRGRPRKDAVKEEPKAEPKAEPKEAPKEEPKAEATPADHDTLRLQIRETIAAVGVPATAAVLAPFNAVKASDVTTADLPAVIAALQEVVSHAD